MRIISGIYRHRIIKECNLETTRETQDRVREAIFNALGPIYGSVLDLFCGSGAMAIEARSRGASKIVLNDLNIKALNVAKENINSLKIDNYELYNLDYIRFIETYSKTFDYIFLDPPYKYTDIYDILNKLKKLTHKGSKVIFEMARETNYQIPEYLSFIKEKTYGKKKVIFMEVIND